MPTCRRTSAHGWKFIGIGPDNKLYIPVGAPCNICLPPDTHAQIRRINLDGSGMEVVAKGVRNTVGFDWHPVSKELYFTDNGRDWVSEDVPEDELNRVTKAGQHFGFAVLLTRATSSIRNSAGATRATSSRSRC